MKTLKLGKHTIEQYDSIDELPMARYQKFSKFMLVDAGLGSDIDHFAEHANRIAAFIRADRKEDALKEIRNMVQCVNLICNEVSPAFLAYASLIKSIDGEAFDDLSEDGLLKVKDKLADVPFVDLFAKLGEVKKKLESELTLYFPRLFESSDTKEYYTLLKKKAQLIAEQLQKKDLYYQKEELDAIDDQLLTFSPPMVFTGPNSMEIKSDKQYHDGCLVITSQTHTDASRLTVLEYYNALNFIQDKQKKQQKDAKKHR